MDFETLIARIAKILYKLNIPYFITGGYAVSVWGRLRATFDVDVVVEMAHPHVAQLARELKKLGKAVYVDEAMMRSALLMRGEFNIIHGESGIKIDFFIPQDTERLQHELKRAKTRMIKGQRVYFISPEDLILSKLRWYNLGGGEHHLEDAASVIKRMGSKLYYPYLKAQAKEQAITFLWKKVMGLT